MAVSHNNPILKKIHGMVGDIIVFRQVRGKTVIQLRPNPSRKQSPLQKGNRNRFAEASSFAMDAMQNPELKEEYTKQAKRLKLPNAYTAALTHKLREWKDEAWKAKRAAQKAVILQEETDPVHGDDNNRSTGHIECRDERIWHTDVNPLGPENEMEATFENVMRHLQESIYKVDRLLSGKNQAY